MTIAFEADDLPGGYPNAWALTVERLRWFCISEKPRTNGKRGRSRVAYDVRAERHSVTNAAWYERAKQDPAFVERRRAAARRQRERRKARRMA